MDLSPDPGLPADAAGGAGGITVTLHETEGGAVVVEVAGDVDMGTAPELREQAGAALDRHPTTLVVDLLGADFLASAGLSVLIEVRSRTDQEGIRLAIVADGYAVLRALEIVGLDTQFDLYATRAAALAG
jgi:anti-anti-sigma factor